MRSGVYSAVRVPLTMPSSTVSTRNVMRIGILGAGRVGAGLGRLWEAAGHDVRLSTRETVAETAAFGEVVVLAVPAGAAEEVLRAAGPIAGKVLVDATNNLRGGPGTLQIARLAPEARVVKAFNTVFAALYEEIGRATVPPSMVFCGDDTGAKEIVATLIQDAGFEPVDAGPLGTAPDVEAFARLVIGIAYSQGRGPFVYRFGAP
jgi:predicted dinucleotide-binding enzyme